MRVPGKRWEATRRHERYTQTVKKRERPHFTLNNNNNTTHTHAHKQPQPKKVVQPQQQDGFRGGAKATTGPSTSTAVQVALRQGTKGERPNENGLFQVFTNVDLPPSLQREKAKEERRKENEKSRRTLAGTASNKQGGEERKKERRLTEEEVGERMDAHHLKVELDGVRDEYPIEYEARLMRLAEILYARYDGSLPPTLNNWDAPYCHLNANARELLGKFVAEVSAEDSKSFVDFVLGQPLQPALRLCAYLVARQHPAMVIDAVRANDSKIASYLLVAAAGTSPESASRALQTFLGSRQIEALSEIDTAGIDCIISRMGSSHKLNDHELAVRLIKAWLPTERGVALFSHVIIGAFAVHPAMFEALFPFALSDVSRQADALQGLAVMLQQNEQCFRSWPRLHPLHVMASANLFTFLAKSDMVFPSSAVVEKLVSTIERVPVQKKLSEVHAVACENAHRWLARVKRQSSSVSHWIAALAGAALATVGAVGYYVYFSL